MISYKPIVIVVLNFSFKLFSIHCSAFLEERILPKWLFMLDSHAKAWPSYYSAFKVKSKEALGLSFSISLNSYDSMNSEMRAALMFGGLK